MLLATHFAVRARPRRHLGAATLTLVAALANLSCTVDRRPPPEVDDSTLDMTMAPPADAPPCQGLGCAIANCPAGTETVVTGTVTAPNGSDPIREALVYVPSSGVPEEFPPQVACEVCNNPIGGKPIVETLTGVDGTFELRRVPVTASTPIVIQKGRWRKVVHLNVGRCEKQGLTAEEGRLPRTQRDGVLPRMAVAVGEWDAIECVLSHIGLDKSEFGAPNSASAVHLYENEKSGGRGAPGGVSISDLLTDLNRMLNYNLIFINCSDDDNSAALLKNPAVLKNLREYVARGGRMYVTDWSYDFIAQVPEFAPFLCWNDDKPCTTTTPHGFHEATRIDRVGLQTSFTADIEQTTPGGRALAQWMSNLSPPIRGGRVPIEDPVASYVLLRQTASDQLKWPSTSWLSADLAGSHRPVSVSFDYPPGPQACGRVLFSNYHTREHADHAALFPSYCPTDAMIAQEHVLEYLIFELSSCVQPPG